MILCVDWLIGASLFFCNEKAMVKVKLSFERIFTRLGFDRFYFLQVFGLTFEFFSHVNLLLAQTQQTYNRYASS